MRFSTLCQAYVDISKTSKRLEKTAILERLLKETPDKDLESVMMLLKGRVFPEWEKTQIGISEKTAIKAVVVATGASEADVLKRFKKEGDLGVVAAGLVGKKSQATLAREDLTVADVLRDVRKLATIEGTGSVDTKLKMIAKLLGNASPDEARFLIRILLEDLRIGIADGSVRDAIVWHALERHEQLRYDPAKGAWPEGAATQVTAWTDAVQNALDRSNDAAKTALTVREHGLAGLEKVALTIGAPTKVMLAQRATDLADAFERVGKPAALEFKYDGFRLQIHKRGKEVTLFTRRLENVTEQFPDVVQVIREHIAHDCILDAEAVGVDPKTGRHVPFQHVSQRIRRKYDIDQLMRELPVEVYVFDLLLLGKDPVYTQGWQERRKALEHLVPIVKGRLRPSDLLRTDEEEKARAYYERALAAGYEGLMFKALDAPYKPGSRVGFMVKLKPTLDTLDCVVVGAEWGEGKRSGWFTSFTLAVVDDDGELVEIGRVGTGLKELENEEGAATFQEMTDLLKPLVTHETGKEVTVRPKVVLEVKCEEIQKSPSYSSGFALRFPRVVRVRSDRRATEASTVSDVLDIFDAQKGKKRTA